ncbi:FIP1[V]-like protein isoform X6 [Beta vulgaris subsp. vulgaris]|uniref:FIP1[V]-like protein isoform X6 n=1 Tax=Beta vulgaris subsp. vulgaris TaxID=3555 RepID=UPI0020374CC0|nr:FIP1[V]-like protein isoform X6 [Beta vulgaris subsp. vulgaris]
MEDLDDDFGDLYADVELQASSAINGVSDFSGKYSKHQHNNEVRVDERRENNSGVRGSERREKGLETTDNANDEVEVENDSDSSDDDDFDVVVNDEDFGPKNGGGDGRRCNEEVVEEMEVEFVEGNLTGKNRMRIDIDQLQLSGGGGGGGGNVMKNGSNSEYKNLRRYSPVFVGNQRAVSSWKANREDVWYGQPRMSGFVPGLAGNGNNFWLPWYRTILDVDIDAIEQKSWTQPGADKTDYFNFEFDEESWRNYCQSLDQLRQRTFSQTRNQNNEAGPVKELESEGFVDAESIPYGLRKMTSHESAFATRQFKKQIGQAIHVESSNIERQPSTDARRPCNRDSDVIQITVQDPEEPSFSGNEELENTPETQFKMSEKGYDHENVELEAEKPGGPEIYETGKIFMEGDSQRSSVSSDCKRSYESAAISSHTLQDSNAQRKDQKSKLDVQSSGHEDIYPGGNSRAPETLYSSMEDVDCSSSDTTETNPCAAMINLSFDDHVDNSSSPYSNTWSEASKDDDHCDLKRTRDLRRSSSDSLKNRHQGGKVDYHRSRRKRYDNQRKERGGKCRLRVRNEEDLKHDGRMVRRHLELKNYSGEDYVCQSGISEPSYGLDRSRAHHRKSEGWCSALDDEYSPTDRENEISLGCYDRSSVEKRFQAERTKDFNRQVHSGSRDVDIYFQKEWDEEQFYSDRMTSPIVQKDRHLQERECIMRDEKSFLRDQQYFMSKFSSSRGINRYKQQRKYDDVHFDGRSKHGQSLLYRYSDGPVHNRHERLNPLDDRQSKFLDLEIEHERRSWNYQGKVETSGRGDEYFETTLDMDYPRYTVYYDDEYWKGQTSTSTHDYRDGLPTDDEGRLQNNLYRDDEDEPQLYQKYQKHSRSMYAKIDIDSRHVYDHKDAYSRQDAARYLDEDDYFEKRRKVFQSKGMSWNDDTLFDGCSDDEFCDESFLEFFKGTPRHKWHGVKHGFVRGRIMHTQIVKGRYGVVSDGGGKPYSKMSARAKHEKNWLRGRNAAELRHSAGERKARHASKC